MAERNTVPNLETKATDGNPVFTLRQWLERFRQFCKREHKIDITPLLKGENITDANWNGKEQAVQEDFIRGVGPEALYQITRAEYKTEPDSIKVKDLIRLFTEFYMPKRNTYHNRGDFFWAKQTEDETPEEFWRRLIGIEEAQKQVEQRSTLSRPGTLRRRYDHQTQRTVFVTTRPKKRSREEIAEIHAELLRRANRLGGGYHPINLEEETEEMREEGAVETAETEEDSVRMRGDNLPIADLNKYY